MPHLDNVSISIEEDPFHIPETVLTRYLYSKSEVIASLCMALLDRNKDEALFWGYELYFSGFDEETFGILSQIYESYYRLVNPKLASYLWRMTMEWNDDRTLHHILGSIIVNMIFRQASLISVLVQREIDVYHANAELTDELELIDYIMNGAVIPDEKRIRIMFTVSDIEPYVNPVHEKGKGWKILRERCRYTPRRYAIDIMASIPIPLTINDTVVMQSIISGIDLNCVSGTDILQNWTYFASFSPVWRERLREFGGKQNHETMMIEFSDDELFEQFHCLYGYEPDEQDGSVIDKYLNRSEKPQQMKWNEFCGRYHTSVIKIAPIKIRHPSHKIDEQIMAV